MSPLLSKSFDALKISTPDSVKRSITNTIRPKKQSHAQFYGYAISQEWLVQFAEQHCPEALPDRNERGYEDTTISRAYEHLVDLTGINNLDLVTCFDPKGGSVPSQWIAVYDGDYDDVLSDEELLAIRIDTVYVLTVCSDEDGSFEERPIQEQMDYITELVGHGPQWWMGCRNIY